MSKDLKYTFPHGEHDLAGQNNAWLRSACRERGIKGYSQMNRKQLKKALLEWRQT